MPRERRRSRQVGVGKAKRFMSSGPFSRTVLVSGFHTQVTSDDIKEIFDNFGIVQKAFVKFDEEGQSTGEAVVTFKDPKMATSAMKELDGARIDDQPIEIRYSLPSKRGLMGLVGKTTRGRTFKNNSWVRGRD